MSLANIFFPSVACLLILLTVSCEEQKFLILMKSSFSFPSFMDHAFDIINKKSSPNPQSSRFSLMLSCKSFIVLHFTFRFIIHFESIFVNSVKFVTRFSFLPVVV